MRKPTMLVLVLILGTVFVFGGCGDTKESGGTKKASTPKEAIENFRQSILDKDKDAFVACFATCDDTKEMIDCLGAFVITSQDFKAAMEKEYGKGSATAVKSEIGDVQDEKWIDTITIKEEGDKATATMKGKKQPLELVKKDDVWLIDPHSIASGKEMKPEQVKMMVGMFGAMNKAMEAQKANIGKDGYTAEKINKELEAAIMGAMMGSMIKKPGAGTPGTPAPLPTP